MKKHIINQNMPLRDVHYSLIEYISLLMEEKNINNIRDSSDFDMFRLLLSEYEKKLLNSVLAGDLKQTFIKAVNEEEQQQEEAKRDAKQQQQKVNRQQEEAKREARREEQRKRKEQQEANERREQQEANKRREQRKRKEQQEANERKKQQQTNYEKEQKKFDEKYKEEVFRIFHITEEEWEQQRKHHEQIRFRYKKKFQTIFKEMSKEQNNKYEKFTDKWNKLYNNMFDKSVTWKLFPGPTQLRKYWNDFFEQFENYWKTIRHELNNIRIDYYLVPKGIHKEIDIPRFIELEKYARKYWIGAESHQRDYYNELRSIDIEKSTKWDQTFHANKERQQENKDQRNNRRKERQQNKTYPKQSSPFIPTGALTADNIDSFDRYEVYKILGLKEKTSIDKRGIQEKWLILLGKFNPQQVRNAQKTGEQKEYLSKITAKINNAKDILTNEKEEFDEWVTAGRRGPFKFQQEKICFRF